MTTNQNQTEIDQEVATDFYFLLVMAFAVFGALCLVSGIGYLIYRVIVLA